MRIRNWELGIGVLILLSIPLYAQPEGKIYGVTITSIDKLSDIIESLQRLKKKPTARIVFDEWQPAADYEEAVREIHKVSYTMGEILDSWAMKQYSVKQYTDRMQEYIDLLGDGIDIWEIGNEVNGEWLGNREEVKEKIVNAYKIVKSRDMAAAMTLFYNEFCFQNPADEMFTWARNLPAELHNGLDYVFVSYYAEDCENYMPNWNSVFSRLQVIFPKSKLGIGECGTKNNGLRKSVMKEYYSLRVEVPSFVGGYFWWYYNEDCVPYSKPMWKVLNKVISEQ